MRLKTKVKQKLSILLEQYNNETTLVKYGDLADVQQAYILSELGLESAYAMAYIKSLGIPMPEMSKYAVFTFSDKMPYSDQIAIISFMTEYSLNPLTNEFMEAILLGNPVLIDNALGAIKDFIKHH